MSVLIVAHHFYKTKESQIPSFSKKKKSGHCIMAHCFVLQEVQHCFMWLTYYWSIFTHHIHRWGIYWFSYFDRLEYEQLKSKCREMDSTVGSGRVITMPVITEDGQPIENPNSDGGAAGSEQQNNSAPLPKEVIDWKLTLHQIGKHCCSFFSISYICHGLPRALRPCVKGEARDREHYP